MDPKEWELAQRVIAHGPAALVGTGMAWSYPDSKASGFDAAKAVWSFSPDEAGKLTTLAAQVDAYLKIASPPRPLCLAVFGPPGAGKSHGVKAIRSALERGGTRLPFVELNLTQLADPRELGRAIHDAVASLDKAAVPFLFFDEFDAPLDGKALGWLSWFLAPMQDGGFRHEGAWFDLRRAVFVFAGGTAAKLDDFGQADRDAFRDAKGPDFVSRLRGFLDVQGPNEEPRRGLRRALLVRGAMDKAREAWGGTLAFDEKLQRQLLDAGRYRNGARSIFAVVEMTAAKMAREPRDAAPGDLPDDHLLAMYADRGFLDPARIGGLIGVSDSRDPSAAFAPVVEALWRAGASLGTMGLEGAQGLRVELGKLVQGLPAALAKAPVPTERFVSYVAPVDTKEALPDPAECEKLVRVPVPSPTAWAKADQEAPERVHLALFLARWAAESRCAARVVMGGKTGAYFGRMPGILEETLVALVLGHPLYILGLGAGKSHGAAAVVGRMLGLGDASVVSDALDGPTVTGEILRAAAPFFQPHPGLPVTFDDALALLPAFALGGPRWPPNGLTPEENRELFAMRDPEEIANRILLGLRRRFGS